MFITYKSKMYYNDGTKVEKVEREKRKYIIVRLILLQSVIISLKSRLG